MNRLYNVKRTFGAVKLIMFHVYRATVEIDYIQHVILKTKG